MNVTDSIVYIGVNDHDLDLFEGQYVVPNGMAYNSYVICDSAAAGTAAGTGAGTAAGTGAGAGKIAVLDSVDARFGAVWLGNLAAAIDGQAPDYLIVQHMEPDHSVNITRFMDCYPQAVVVASA